MNEAILSALIAAAATLIVCLINNHFQQRRSDAQQAETVNLITYRLAQLEKKQDIHNNAIKRLYEVERKLGIDEERISVANHRIEDLEQFHK